MKCPSLSRVFHSPNRATKFSPWYYPQTEHVVMDMSGHVYFPTPYNHVYVDIWIVVIVTLSLTLYRKDLRSTATAPATEGKVDKFHMPISPLS